MTDRLNSLPCARWNLHRAIPRIGQRALWPGPGTQPHTIQRIWKAFGLEQNPSETFKLSTDPQFVEKVGDIIGLYLDPPVGGLVR
jgi:hypothetical protein